MRKFQARQEKNHVTSSVLGHDERGSGESAGNKLRIGKAKKVVGARIIQKECSLRGRLQQFSKVAVGRLKL